MKKWQNLLITNLEGSGADRIHYKGIAQILGYEATLFTKEDKREIRDFLLGKGWKTSTFRVGEEVARGFISPSSCLTPILPTIESKLEAEEEANAVAGHYELEPDLLS